VPVQHGDHHSEELFYEVDMKGYDLIFGLLWLEDHNPHIDWQDWTMTFNNKQCYANCLIKGEQVTVRSSRHKKSY
jgi:hypothetical protein